MEVVLDNQFKITEQKINGGNAIALSYDNDALLTGAGSLNITRDVESGLITDTMQTNIITSQSYNSYAEILNFNASYNTTSLYNVDYTQDKLGRITQQIETIDGVTKTLDYSYDLAGRLIQVKTDGIETENYAYDDNGNRTHENGVLTATFDEQDRLLTHGDFVYTYTDNGELLTKTNTVNSEVTSYVYDVLGNLIEVNLPDGTKIEYIIDGLNRRVGEKVNGISTKGWMYQDKFNPVAELDGNNNIVVRFVYGDKLNVPSFMERNGQTYRIISDYLGSPRLIVNVSTGAIEQRIDFDAWGNVVEDSNPEFQPFGFAGGLYEAQTGFTRFGARDYDASISRWTTKDPIRFTGGDSNIYGYVLNNPVNSIDHSGLASISMGYTGSFFEFVAGADGSVFVGFDTSGKACLQIRTCGNLGLGLSGGAGTSYKFSTANFCEGEKVIGGITGSLGDGPTIKGTILTDGNETSTTLTLGVGGGASLAGTTCMVKTICL